MGEFFIVFSSGFPTKLHNTLFVDLGGEMLPPAELTLFHAPYFDTVAKHRVAIRGRKRTLIGNGDPIAVDTTTRLGQSEVAHRRKQRLVEREVDIEILYLEVALRKTSTSG